MRTPTLTRGISLTFMALATVRKVGGRRFLSEFKLRQISFVHPRTFPGGVAEQSVKKFSGLRDYLWSFLAIIQI
jgi:hypothetical protein